MFAALLCATCAPGHKCVPLTSCRAPSALHEGVGSEELPAPLTVCIGEHGPSLRAGMGLQMQLGHCISVPAASHHTPVPSFASHRFRVVLLHHVPVQSGYE
jgi:hypothetical protein